jgi:hypothetical protein
MKSDSATFLELTLWVLRYKCVNFGAKTRPREADRPDQIACDRGPEKESTNLQVCSRSCLSVQQLANRRSTRLRLPPTLT